jgi:hypothetical protein
VTANARGSTGLALVKARLPGDPGLVAGRAVLFVDDAQLGADVDVGGDDPGGDQELQQVAAGDVADAELGQLADGLGAAGGEVGRVDHPQLRHHRGVDHRPVRAAFHHRSGVWPIW